MFKNFFLFPAPFFILFTVYVRQKSESTPLQKAETLCLSELSIIPKGTNWHGNSENLVKRMLIRFYNGISIAEALRCFTAMHAITILACLTRPEIPSLNSDNLHNTPKKSGCSEPFPDQHFLQILRLVNDSYGFTPPRCTRHPRSSSASHPSTAPARATGRTAHSRRGSPGHYRQPRR